MEGTIGIEEDEVIRIALKYHDEKSKWLNQTQIVAKMGLSKWNGTHALKEAVKAGELERHQIGGRVYYRKAQDGHTNSGRSVSGNKGSRGRSKKDNGSRAK
jgi:hypothetical protein